MFKHLASSIMVSPADFTRIESIAGNIDVAIADIIERNPTIHEFNELRESVGWSTVDEKTLSIALGSSLYSICAVAKGKTIGIARLIGDGALYYYIQDFIVHLAVQRKGIGNSMLKKIMKFFEDHAPKGSFIGLMSAKGKEGFYRNFGFIEQPNDVYGAGMWVIRVKGGESYEHLENQKYIDSNCSVHEWVQFNRISITKQ